MYLLTVGTLLANNIITSAIAWPYLALDDALHVLSSLSWGILYIGWPVQCNLIPIYSTTPKIFYWPFNVLYYSFKYLHLTVMVLFVGIWMHYSVKASFMITVWDKFYWPLGCFGQEKVHWSAFSCRANGYKIHQVVVSCVLWFWSYF